MPAKKKLYRALVGMNLPDGDKHVRIEAGEIIPERLHDAIPAVWLGVKVEVK